MRTVAYEKIVSEVSLLCETACIELPADVYTALEKAQKNETNATAKETLGQLLENAKIAKQKHIPLCQDTGLAVVFLKMGNQVCIEPQNKTITEAINEGVEKGYQQGLLRKSVVSEPLQERKNTNTNTPAIIHTEITAGTQIEIEFMAKGGGCENKSQFKMFLPTDDKTKIIDWVAEVAKSAGANACPPFVIGVGIGGDFEQCCLLSKKALLKNLNTQNSEPFYALMEEEILKKINSSGIGAAGFGGYITALAVKIEVAGCHIASLPVAVNIECHAHRHTKTVI